MAVPSLATKASLAYGTVQQHIHVRYIQYSTVHDRTWQIRYGTTSYTIHTQYTIVHGSYRRYNIIYMYDTYSTVHDRARHMRYSTGSYRIYSTLASSQPRLRPARLLAASLPSSASIIAAAMDAPPARPRLISPLPCRARWRCSALAGHDGRASAPVTPRTSPQRVLTRT